MTPGEVGARAVRGVRHGADDLEWRLARRRWKRRWEPPVLREPPPRRPLGFLTADKGAALAERDPDGAGRLVERADRTLRGEVSLLGYETVVLPLDRRDYALDPVAGFRWPDGQGRRLDYRHAQADPKWIWELNRCQELPVLAAAWLATGDKRYAEAAAGGLLHWVEQQAPGRGIAWANGFEAALRAISLAVTYDALAADPARDAELRRPALGTLWQHARWIEADPSTHSSANNHRIGELVGMLAIALLAPELPGASGRVDTALAGLRAEAGRQIRPDGTGAEQAFAYTVFVADLLLLAVALLDAAGRPAPEEVLQALDRVGRGFWAELGRPGEPEPTYGDDDGGRALRLDGLEARTARGVASSICARLGQTFARTVAERLDETAWWLFGDAGRVRFGQTAAAEPPGDVVLPDGGHAVLRRGDTRVGFMAGPLGYLSLAAHGHAAALGLTVSRGGVELVSDPGTGTYFGEPEVRSAFRGTGLHGTVLVDGRDQSEAGGPFLWTRHARAWLTHVDPDGGVVAAEHDGYLSGDDPVRHRRAVVLVEEGVLVCDRLEALREHAVSLRWPLHESMSAELLPGSEVQASSSPQARLLVKVAATSPGSMSVAHGEREPFAGWSSRRLGLLVPSPLVRWDARFSGRLDVVTFLAPASADEWPRVDLALRRDHDAMQVDVTTDGASRTARIDFGDPRGIRLVS